MGGPLRNDDLLGERPAPAKRKGNGKAEPKSDGSVKRCLDLYIELYRKKWNGLQPHIKFAKDGKHFKDMVATWGEPAVRSLVEQFFETSHPRVTRTDYSVGALYSVAQTLMLEGQRVTDERTLGNLDAAQRATRRRLKE